MSNVLNMIALCSANVGVQPRVLLIDRAAMIYCEPRDAYKDAEAEQAENKIESGPHQIDPNRPVSRVAVMPQIMLARTTGNAYPADVNDPSIVTSKSWRQYVTLARAVHTLLLNAAEPVTAAQIADAACKLASIGADSNGNATRKALNVVLDTLRDLRCFGLATSDTATASVKTTKFAAVTDFASLETISEYRARLKAEQAALEQPAETVEQSAEQPAKRKNKRSAA